MGTEKEGGERIIPIIVIEHNFLHNAFHEKYEDDIVDELNDYLINRFVMTRQKIAITTSQVANRIMDEIPYSLRFSKTVRLTFDYLDIKPLPKTIHLWESTIKKATALTSNKNYGIVYLSLVKKEKLRERIANTLGVQCETEKTPKISLARIDEQIPFEFLNPKDTFDYLEKNDKEFKLVKEYLEKTK